MQTNFHIKPDIDAMATTVAEEIRYFVKTSPLNRLSLSDEKLFEEPIVHYADGNDPLFMDFKNIIDPSHLTPHEALAKSYSDNYRYIMNSFVSVISWILPTSKAVRDANRLEKQVPSRIYLDYYARGEVFNRALREHVVHYLSDMGYQATAPAEQTYFKYRDYSARIGYYSNWSERHIAYAAGLGTFGLSDGFITEKGISHRCGSVVTNLRLPASPRTAKNMYANCLFYRNGSCRACIKRCPVKAISHKGHDKQKCFHHMQIDLAFLKDKYELNGTGCALCQTKVPCECGNPVKSK